MSGYPTASPTIGAGAVSAQIFQAAKRKTRGYTQLSTARTVIFLLAGKLDFQTTNPHAHA